MRLISQKKLLDLWEQGIKKSPLYFSLLIICEFFPEVTFEKALLLPVGVRDKLLFKIRRRVCGESFSSIAVCNHCGEKVEWQMKYEDFGLPAMIELPETTFHTRKKGKYNISFRLPNSNDLFGLLNKNNKEDTFGILASECFGEISYDKKKLKWNELPEDILDYVWEYMAKKDEFADIRFTLTCPGCRHQWESTFDIVNYFWAEINALSNRLLYEVGILAQSFGWSEKDILELSPERRHMYIEMLS